MAVKAGSPRPDVSSGEAVKKALLSAGAVAYSTGASGVYVQRLFDRLGIADQMKDKSKQTSPGVRVAQYLASGEADLGFQQVSELVHETGIDFLRCRQTSRKGDPHHRRNQPRSVSCYPHLPASKSAIVRILPTELAGPSTLARRSRSLVTISSVFQPNLKNAVENMIDRIVVASRQNSGPSKQPLSIADIISLPFSRRSNRMNQRSAQDHGSSAQQQPGCQIPLSFLPFLHPGH